MIFFYRFFVDYVISIYNHAKVCYYKDVTHGKQTSKQTNKQTMAKKPTKPKKKKTKHTHTQKQQQQWGRSIGA